MSNHQQIVDYYNEIATNYDHSRFENTYGEFIDQQERRILNKLHINPKHTLDLPCGTGRLLNYADYGCDASEKMLECAKARWADKQLICGDARNLPYEDASFDTIITMHMLMHLDAETIEAVMKEVHRVLRPGGRWIMDVPSLKRRKLTSRKEEGWHGSSAKSVNDIQQLVSQHYEITSSHGIMLLPVHRIATRLRKPLCKLDSFLSQVPKVKEYCSYMLFELTKK